MYGVLWWPERFHVNHLTELISLIILAWSQIICGCVVPIKYFAVINAQQSSVWGGRSTMPRKKSVTQHCTWHFPSWQLGRNWNFDEHFGRVGWTSNYQISCPRIIWPKICACMGLVRLRLLFWLIQLVLTPLVCALTVNPK